jgi:hypothetical protein
MMFLKKLVAMMLISFTIRDISTQRGLMAKNRLTFLWIVVLLLALPSLAGEVTIPQTAASADLADSIPLWVSEEMALDAHGNLKVDLFHRHRIKRFLGLSGAVDSEGCTITVARPALEQAVDGRSIDSLARSSRRIIRGEVVASGEGFFVGIPGTLYAVRVDDVISDEFTAPVVYLFLGVARIELANATICSTLWKDSLQPAVGDKLVAFVHFKASDSDGKIFEIHPQKQLFLQRGDEIRRPSSLTSLAEGARLADVMGIARQARVRSLREHD